jgi:hypothetical protein
MAILLFCAVMLFTTKQSENLFWGFQFPWAIITFLSVLSFILFEKAISLGKWKYLVVSIICAYAASFSSAHGLYISTTCIIIYILLMLTRQKINRNFFCAYIVSTIALFCIYFLIEPVYFPQQMLDKKIIDLIKFYIVAMGSSFNHSLFSGIIIIGLCVYACVYCIIKKNILENILPLSLIIFSNIFIASITMGRAMQGLRIATSSRYVTVTLLCCIGIALIAFINIKNRKLLTIMLIIFMLANICAQFEKLGNRDWITVPISYGIWWKTLQENSYKICKNYEQVANQNITYLKIANYEAPEITYAYLRIMDKNKWSIFAND